MHIRQLFHLNRPVFSIELFPPKTPEGVENLKKKLLRIRAFAPDYVSVTYGAGGSTQLNTLEICAYIKQRLGMEVMAHLTCVSQTKEEIHAILDDFLDAGIDNIMALRGDPPQGQDRFIPPEGGFGYASELVAAVRKANNFGIGVAGYPEGHVEAKSYEKDMGFLAQKVSNGAGVIISQFFLDNEDFLRWREDLRKIGVDVPVEAGILPALSADQIIRFAKMNGAKVPAELLAGLEKLKDDKEGSAAFGLEYAVKQVENLLSEGVDGIHLYALNRLEPIRAIEPLVRSRSTISALSSSNLV